ncbi:MAG: endonuclease domain-containing protein [Solirubrobacteraceae bacterium MAG38_C4-C5]|nr:endonuclease domain-containing protein [Candidatus Siliceabacter maunaloa]
MTQGGIELHRTRTLTPPSVTVVRGIVTTTVSRTLIDLTECSPDNHLRRAVDEADRLGWLNLRDLDARMTEATGRHGLPRLQRLLQRHRPTGFSRSDLERRFLSLTAAVGLPTPLVNHTIEGLEVDFHWPDRRLVVEIDSYEYHRTRARFEADRARDRHLTLAGWRVLRITDHALVHEPQAVEADLRAATRSPAP